MLNRSSIRDEEEIQEWLKFKILPKLSLISGEQLLQQVIIDDSDDTYE